VAVRAEAALGEPHAPHVEELAEREDADRGRLDVNDPRGVVRVDRGQEALLLVDADQGGDGDMPAVDEQVEMLVDVDAEGLGRRGPEGRWRTAARAGVSPQAATGPGRSGSRAASTGRWTGRRSR